MTMPPETPLDENELPPHLKRLRTLVTVLTVVMIGGVLTIILLLVMRLTDNTRPILVHPEVFAIPEGVGTVGYSVIDGRTIIIGDDGIIRVFDSGTRDLQQEMILGAP